jgi:hypothetical protein
MNKLSFILMLLVLVTFTQCSKNKGTDGIASVNEFFVKYGPAIQTYNVDGAAGGMFITPQGTRVSIPSGAFVFSNNQPVTGAIEIQFKDLYLKGDMLMSLMATQSIDGMPLKSGGEFFFNARKNGEGLTLAPGKSINVEQPGDLTGGVDSINRMKAFVVEDSLGGGDWIPSNSDTLVQDLTKYIFKMYSFSGASGKGKWSNSDNSTFFSSYPKANLSIQPKDNPGDYNTEVFLIIKDISTMVHIYKTGNDFTYMYAPKGLEGTIVAVGVKGENLYSAFIPLNISGDKSLDLTLSQMKPADFITKLKALK